MGSRMSVPPATDWRNFVKQYYSTLAETPDQLSRLYTANSVFSFSRGSHGGGPGSIVQAVGQEQIHNQIMATLRPFNGRPCKAKVVALDGQESHQGGVLVLATCYLIITGTPITQHFTQSFFLEKHTEPREQYVVLIDILRYLPPTVTTAIPPQPGRQETIMAPTAFFHGGLMQPGSGPGANHGQAQTQAEQMHPSVMQMHPQQQALMQQQSGPWPQSQPGSTPPQPLQGMLQSYSGPTTFAASLPNTDLQFQNVALAPMQPSVNGDSFVSLPVPGSTGPMLASGSSPLTETSLGTTADPICSVPQKEYHQKSEGEKNIQQELVRLEEVEKEVRTLHSKGCMNLKERESQEQRLLEVEQLNVVYHDEDEVDERVAVVSLDIEEEEEEEYVQDEEVDEEEEEEEMRAASAVQDESVTQEKRKIFDFDSELTKMEAQRPNEDEQPPPVTTTVEQRPCEEPSPSEEGTGGGEPLADFLLEEPPTWASMAGRLQQGGGQLRPSKMQGFGCPAVSKAPPSALTAPSASASSTSPPAPAAQSKSGHVWIWVSRFPNDPIADNNEVLECLNAKLTDLGTEEHIMEIERRDPLQEWASVSVTSQEAADTLITLSKDRRLLLRGKPLKAEPYRTSFNSRRQGRGGGGGVASKGASGSNGQEDRSAAGDGRGGSKYKRRERGNGKIDGRERYNNSNSQNHSSPGESGSRRFGRLQK